MLNKDKNINDLIEPINLGHLRKIIKSLEALPDTAKISFEYLLTATFPSVWNNVKEFGNKCYTEGYIQGSTEKDKKDENSGNN